MWYSIDNGGTGTTSHKNNNNMKFTKEVNLEETVFTDIVTAIYKHFRNIASEKDELNKKENSVFYDQNTSLQRVKAIRREVIQIDMKLNAAQWYQRTGWLREKRDSLVVEAMDICFAETKEVVTNEWSIRNTLDTCQHYIECKIESAFNKVKYPDHSVIRGKLRLCKDYRKKTFAELLVIAA